MSWCGGGDMSDMPGMEWRVRAITSFTLKPGSWPPSPGLAPCATLICISSALTRYSVVTPKRPLATCLVFDERLIPSTSEWKRSSSSPPSPVFERVPSLFIARQMASWASFDSAPNDMAPVTKCFTISLSGSTSSMLMGCCFHPMKSRRNIGCSFSSARRANCLYFS